MINKPRWGLTQIILVYAGILVIGLLYAGLAMDIVTQWLQSLGIAETGNFLVSFLVQFISTIGLVYLFAVFLPRGSWRDLGLIGRDGKTYWQYGVGGGALLIVLIMVMSIPIQYFQPELSPQYFEEMLRTTSDFKEFIIFLLVGSLLGPFSEELFYRGMIYPVFRRYLGPLWGAVAAGLIFGIVHWDPWRAIPLAAGGMGLCYLYEKSNSILVTTVAHGVWNAFMSIMVYLSLNG
ncbi:MAG: type II CAAX endopeptidase family protein [Bacillota bacterium]|nr:type II CAAX endopeptidase family protein [Bacillota bacterium]